MRNYGFLPWVLAVLLLAGSGAARAATQPGAPSFTEPFARDSCWKAAIPVDATYVDVRNQWKKLVVHSAGIAVTKWTVGVYQAKRSDPRVHVLYASPTLYERVQSGAVLSSGNPPALEAQLRQACTAAPTFDQPYYAVPATGPFTALRKHPPTEISSPKGALPSPDADGHLVILQSDGHTLFEAFCAVILHNGDIICPLADLQDLTGPGDGGTTGLRASMLPALGGLIRKGELAHGAIEHALTCTLYRGCLQRGAHVWPALSHDTNSRYFGVIPLGARLAVPRDVDLATLGLTPKGLTLARALQQYGMYVSDRGGEGGMSICAELGCAEADPRTQYREWWSTDGPRILKELQMVQPPDVGPHAVRFAPGAGEENEIQVHPPTEPTIYVGSKERYTEIAPALAALPATGGTVRVRAGTYEIREALRLPSNTALIGDGSEYTKIKVATGIIAHGITNADSQQGNHDILIKNLAIIGNLDSNGVPPRGKPTQGNDGCRGIYLHRVTNARVEGCFITETGTNSFLTSDSTRIAFVGNTEKFCFHCLNFTQCTRCIVAHNTTLRKWSGEAPYFNNTGDSEVYDNDVEGVGMDGMALDFNSSNNLVHDNTIIGCYMSGIVVQGGAHHNTIEDNLINGNGRYVANPTGRIDGIYLLNASHNRIIDNRCCDDQPVPTQRYGINIANAACAHNELRANDLRGNARGEIQDLGTDTVIATPDSKPPAP